MISICSIALICQVATPGPSVSPLDVHCGSYTLYVALKALDLGPSTYEELESSLGDPGEGGYSMQRLLQEAEKRGAKTIAVETSIDNLRARPEKFACITLIDDAHFVLMSNIEGNLVTVVDPPKIYELESEVFLSRWDGRALLLGLGDFLSEESISRRRLFRQLMVFAVGIIVLGVIAVGSFRLIFRRMLTPKFLMLLGSVVALSATTGCREPIPPGASFDRPLLVEPEYHQLGPIVPDRPGQTVETHTKIRNVGDRPVTIEKIMESCFCTNVQIDSSVIMPASHSTLTANLKLGSMNEKMFTRVSLFTDDPVDRMVEIKFEWETVNQIFTDSSTIEFPQLQVGETSSREVPIYVRGLPLCPDCDVRIVADSRFLACSPDFSGAARVPSHSHDPTQAPDLRSGDLVGYLRVDLIPQNEPRHFKQIVSVEVCCNEDVRSHLDIPVNWRVVQSIGAHPNKLSFGRCAPGHELQKQVILTSMEARPFAISGVECSAVGVLGSARYDPSSDISHVLELDFTVPTSAKGVWESAIEIRTDDPDTPQLTIPILALIDD